MELAHMVGEVAMDGFSPWVLAVLVAVLTASWLMLAWLTRSWTMGRRRARLMAWARSAGLVVGETVPEALRVHLAALGAVRVIVGFAAEDRFVCRLRAERTPASQRPMDASSWVFAGRRLQRDIGMKLAGLRPARSSTSLVDVLAADAAPKLWSYPSIELGGAAADAFTIFAGSPADARAMAGSRFPAELPEDLGLLVSGEWLILDLSARPFDELELARAMELLENLQLRP